MNRKTRLKKDTFILSLFHLSTDTLSLLLNLFLTKEAGSSAVGAISLTMSFFSLMSVISGGSIFLCVCLFVSEEMGKKNGDPKSMMSVIFRFGIVLSIICSFVIYAASEHLSRLFFGSSEFSSVIKLLSFFIPLSTLGSGLSGCLFADNKALTGAAADIIRFIVQSALFIFLITELKPSGNTEICQLLVFCNIAGCIVSILYLFFFFRKTLGSINRSYTHQGKIKLSLYLKTAVPVMAGSAVKSFLSSANDALIPFTLKQYGSSSDDALAQLGIFEGIVIPALFFPSLIVCSFAEVLLPEIARLSSSNGKSSQYLINRTLYYTFLFSFFISSVFLILGKSIGELLSSGSSAGIYISLLAPSIPFIYSEIILESILKAKGYQNFSTVNYIAEYVIRISAVLISIPIAGFYGIIISYYASNIFGNVSRLIKVFKTTSFCSSLFSFMFTPLFCAVFSAYFAKLIFRFTASCNMNIIVYDILFTLTCAAICFAVHKILKKCSFGIYCKMQISHKNTV